MLTLLKIFLQIYPFSCFNIMSYFKEYWKDDSTIRLKDVHALCLSEYLVGLFDGASQVGLGGGGMLLHIDGSR